MGRLISEVGKVSKKKLGKMVSMPQQALAEKSISCAKEAFAIEDIMTRNPKTINKDLKLYEAEKIFNRYEIVTLIVADDEGKLLGLLQHYDVDKPREERRYAKM